MFEIEWQQQEDNIPTSVAIRYNTPLRSSGKMGSRKSLS